jgi:hypothetical protein
MLPSGLEKLYWLIRLYVCGHHDVETFCREFEQTYNVEIDRSKLSARERSAFAELFDKVTRYSPFPRDIDEYPGYLGAEQIRQAVASAQSALDCEPGVAK